MLSAVFLLVLFGGPLLMSGGTFSDPDCGYVLISGSILVDFGGQPPNESRIEEVSAAVRAGGQWSAYGYRPFAEQHDPSISGGFDLERTVMWSEGVRVSGWLTFHHLDDIGEWVRVRLEGWARGQGAGASAAFQGMVEHILREQVDGLQHTLERQGLSPGAPSVFLENAGACPLPVTA